MSSESWLTQLFSLHLESNLNNSSKISFVTILLALFFISCIQDETRPVKHIATRPNTSLAVCRRYHRCHTVVAWVLTIDIIASEG